MENNEEYIEFNDTQLTLDIGPASLPLDELFKDNEEFTETTTNIKDITEELKPFIEETIGSVLFGMILRLFRYYSIDELFPK